MAPRIHAHVSAAPEPYDPSTGLANSLANIVSKDSRTC
jgi:hypothetical protein